MNVTTPLLVILLIVSSVTTPSDRFNLLSVLTLLEWSL